MSSNTDSEAFNKASFLTNNPDNMIIKKNHFDILRFYSNKFIR